MSAHRPLGLSRYFQMDALDLVKRENELLELTTDNLQHQEHAEQARSKAAVQHLWTRNAQAPSAFSCPRCIKLQLEIQVLPHNQLGLISWLLITSSDFVVPWRCWTLPLARWCPVQTNQNVLRPSPGILQGCTNRISSTRQQLEIHQGALQCPPARRLPYL